jgi:hypothetical protein
MMSTSPGRTTSNGHDRPSVHDLGVDDFNVHALGVDGLAFMVRASMAAPFGPGS